MEEHVEGLPGHPNRFNEARLGATGGLEDFVADTHDFHGKHFTDQVNVSSIGLGKENAYHFCMKPDGNLYLPDPWPQRPRFRALVDEWLAANAEGNSVFERRLQLCKVLGMSPNSLKQLYSGRDAPGRNRLNRIVKALGCSPSDLMDSVAEPPPGVPSSEWENADENARAFANTLWHEVKDLAPYQRKAFLDLVRAWKNIGTPPNPQEKP
jgi:transcriptional regulator with XRE-family HTH domain